MRGGRPLERRRRGRTALVRCCRRVPRPGWRCSRCASGRRRDRPSPLCCPPRTHQTTPLPPANPLAPSPEPARIPHMIQSPTLHLAVCLPRQDSINEAVLQNALSVQVGLWVFAGVGTFSAGDTGGQCTEQVSAAVGSAAKERKEAAVWRAAGSDAGIAICHCPSSRAIEASRNAARSVSCRRTPCPLIPQ